MWRFREQELCGRGDVYSADIVHRVDVRVSYCCAHPGGPRGSPVLREERENRPWNRHVHTTQIHCRSPLNSLELHANEQIKSHCAKTGRYLVTGGLNKNHLFLTQSMANY